MRYRARRSGPEGVVVIEPLPLTPAERRHAIAALVGYVVVLGAALFFAAWLVVHHGPKPGSAELTPRGETFDHADVDSKE